ncbi:perlucin-like [Ptychodera flava]|uniref:perlucin-like n=1 Tax=Ptychodera flava TaxID=63121 RepID=UPI00396A7BFC
MSCLVNSILVGTFLFMSLHDIIMAGCPTNYIPGLNGTRCYRYMSMSGHWAHAKTLCQVDGAHLVDVVNQEENDFLLGFSETLGLEEVWLGLNDQETEGDWNYVAETSAPLFSNWGPGQPDGTANENCALMLKVDLGKWDDKPCAQYHPVVCEQDNVPIQTTITPSTLSPLANERWNHFMRTQVDSGPPNVTPYLTVGLSYSAIDCARKCSAYTECVAFTFKRLEVSGGLHRCKLYTSVFETYPIVTMNGVDMYEPSP